MDMCRLRISLALVGILLAGIVSASAAEFGDPAFRHVWEHTDYPIQQGVADYSWVWGPAPNTNLIHEWYLESPGQFRTVQFFDKSRMEINNPLANPGDPWYVTNGLLVKEMINGEVQVGDYKFIHLAPAALPVAGDVTNTFPTYADLARIYNQPSIYSQNSFVNLELTKTGTSLLPRYSDTPATQITHFEHNYGIHRAFWDYLNRGGQVYENGRYIYRQPFFNWLYVTGYPISDAFWTHVKVAGSDKEVMFQAFERRVLTFTPGNPVQYLVEMGNVGQHYYQWRYVAPFAGGKSGLITLPTKGTMISAPLVVQGFENGSAFEAQIGVRLVTSTGVVLTRGFAHVQRYDYGQSGPFELTLNFTAQATAIPARLELIKTPPSGAPPVVLDSVEVIIAPTSPY
jgi:hypothetical protein